MVQKDLLEDLVGGKEGKKDTKIGGMSRKESILVSERGCFKHTGRCLAYPNLNVPIKRTKILNVCEDWSKSWSWKHEVDVREKTKESMQKGQ